MKKRKENKEKGCTEPLYGEKSKCESLEVDSKCIRTRGSPA
jgi:hypothetical protein